MKKLKRAMKVNSHIIDTSLLVGLTIGQATTLIGGLIKASPKLGDLTVRELAAMSLKGEDPVGIYIFGDSDGRILYVGKTHGRSFHERMISHLDSREPVEGSPHLAQFVTSQVKRNLGTTREEAVDNILNMTMLWIPIPRKNLTDNIHKKFVSLVERRLLWNRSLNPAYNSERVKRNCEITIKGKKILLRENDRLLDLSCM